MDGKRIYSLLLIGLLGDKHIQRLVLHLRKINPFASIDFMATTIPDVLPTDVRRSIDNLYVACNDTNSSSFYKLLYSLKLLKQISNNHYDVVNIHFPCYYHFFYIMYLRKMTATILLTPWGSDVYRVGSIERFLLKKLYRKADKVSSGNNRFGDDVKKIYNLPPEKMVCLDIGSDAIDYISENLDKITREEAKERLSIPGQYVITCSYNGSQAHRHEVIIKAINDIKDKLPSNLILFFPFTYAGTKEYSDRLKQLLKEYGINYRFFEDYLSVDDLFLLRRSSDIFIHIQPSDANSQCLQEYMLCGSKVVNGSWLRYRELEIGGQIPYYLVDDLSNLSGVIYSAYTSKGNLISQEVLDYIKSYGWKEWIKKWDEFYSIS